jgi:hypothetical protein
MEWTHPFIIDLIWAMMVDSNQLCDLGHTIKHLLFYTDLVAMAHAQEHRDDCALIVV